MIIVYLPRIPLHGLRLKDNINVTTQVGAFEMKKNNFFVRQSLFFEGIVELRQKK